MSDEKDMYKEFLKRLKLLISSNKDIIKVTLSNIFTMRIIGNKTHGDLAEVAIVEFVNQYMCDYKAEHIGKEKFRDKKFEEDVKVVNQIEKRYFLISIKAYGHGPLQLSTDKQFKMFPFLEKRMGGTTSIEGKDKIREILESEPFRSLEHLNILPLIYDEERKLCNIMIFDIEKAKRDAYKVEYVKPNKDNRREYPVFIFYNKRNEYICEVRYGGKDANALQRGFWTHTKRAEQYFESLTGGWIDYSDNEVLVKLFRYALVSSEEGHQKAVENLLCDIKRLKRM